MSMYTCKYTFENLLDFFLLPKITGTIKDFLKKMQIDLLVAQLF